MRYVTRVRHIVGEEESMRSRRRMRFADKSFSVSNPGPEFPRSWTSGRGKIANVDPRWTPGEDHFKDFEMLDVLYKMY